MKRLFVIALAVVCGVTFSESFAKKPKKAELTKPQNEETRTQQEKERQELQQKMYLDSIELEAKKRELKELERQLMEMENARPTTKPMPVYEELELPCQEESISTDEYYGAWAVSDGQFNQSFAMQDAMHKAQFALAKQVGGEDVVIENVEVVCRKIMRDELGTFVAYVAVRMPKNNK